MSDERKFPMAALWLAGAVVLTGLIGSYVLVTRRSAATAGPSGAGFQERAQAAGIAFRMNYLQKEQGEHFRVNLYDHGAGVAVGDYDNDSHEDIYFLNQHGPNA